MLLFALSWSVALGQAHWLDKFDGIQACHIVDVVTDAAGYSYVTGDLSSTMTVFSNGAVQGSIPTVGAQDVLVAKFAPGGSLIWAQQAGGPAVDLGLKLALSASGLALTGIFTGQADLFGTTVSAQGGGSDLFVAMLDRADGQAQWVRTAGSPGHTDTPGGITMTATGQVVVAGKFKGDAVFGPQTLHGGIDPVTMLPSFDVFVAAWAADGAFQWAKQGTGPKDCSAVDIVRGPNDELYVTGQFSDTITFDAVHPNTALNNIFTVKFDPQGNEIWFRKCGGGSFSRVSDLRWSAANDLLLTGDQSGTMYWTGGAVSTPVPSTDPYAYFILRVDTSGAVLQATTMGSAANVHAASITEQADSVVILGAFECDFSGLQAAYGANGLFIATGPKDLFIAKHAAADLSFVDAQQFGGSGMKSAGAITNTPDGLIFGGAYTSEIFLPRGSDDWGDPANSCSFLAANEGGTFCGDPNYGNFAWASGTALATGFLTKGHVEGRKPFDLWDRTEADPCDRTAPVDPVRIWYQGAEAPDSITACGEVWLDSHAEFPHWTLGDFCMPNVPTVGLSGPQSWSNGAEVPTIHVSTTGWVSYTLYSSSGCRSWTDSVFVNVLQAPVVSVTDSSGNYYMTTLQNAPPLGVSSCDPLVFWADPIGPTDQAYWVAGTDTIFSDTLHIAASGPYFLHVFAANGCASSGAIDATIFPHADINITGVNSVLIGNDSVQTCDGDCYTAFFSNTWLVDGSPTPLPDNMLVHYQSSSGCNQIGYTDAYQPIPIGIALNGTGWYTLQSEVSVEDQNCATGEYSFVFTDSIYVEVGTVADFSFNQFELQHCTGDTVAIPFTCSTCDSIAWSGPGVVYTSPAGDTVLVDQDGLYSALPLTDSNGFLCGGDVQVVTVSSPVLPSLAMEPEGGILCPNDSALLYTDALGSDYIWTGPGTDSLPHSSSVWVNEAGDYYLTVELYSGCSVSNGPVSLSFFGSPIITGPPAGVLCPGGSVELGVEAGPGGAVQWQAPLSGNAPVQTVSAPGSYSCTVSSCGNTWDLTYNVLLSDISADLGADTFALCSGQPITLTAPPGAASYLWLPSGDTQPQLLVSDTGTVELEVTGADGCSASSGPVQVVEQGNTQPATVDGDSICAGETVLLNAIGSGNLAWYATPDTSELLANGASYSYMPTATDTVFLLQTEDGCPGAFIPVTVVVQTGPPTPLLLGDTTYCTGDSLLLVAEAGPDTDILWSTPWGAYAGDSIGPVGASAMHAGPYACFATLHGCPGDTATTTVLVLDRPNSPEVMGDTLICIGDSLFLQASGTAGSQWAWSTPGGPLSGPVLLLPAMNETDSGLYACWAALGACLSDTTYLRVQLSDCGTVLPPGGLPNVITPNGDGVNDAFQFAGDGFQRAELHVFNRWGQQVALVRGSKAVWNGRNTYSGEVLSEGVYFYTIEAVTDAGEPYRKAGYVQLIR